MRDRDYILCSNKTFNRFLYFLQDCIKKNHLEAIINL